MTSFDSPSESIKSGTEPFERTEHSSLLNLRDNVEHGGKLNVYLAVVISPAITDIFRPTLQKSPFRLPVFGYSFGIR